MEGRLYDPTAQPAYMHMVQCIGIYRRGGGGEAGEGRGGRRRGGGTGDHQPNTKDQKIMN